MPLLYGEGHKAFYRLQEQIILSSSDDTILAWDYPTRASYANKFNYNDTLFAPSPAFFTHCKTFSHCRPIGWDDVIEITNNGIRLKAHYIDASRLSGIHRSYPEIYEGQVSFLNCCDEGDETSRYALRLRCYAGSDFKAYSVWPQAWTGGRPWIPEEACFDSYTRLVQVDWMDKQITTDRRQVCLLTRMTLSEQIDSRLHVTLHSSA